MENFIFFIFIFLVVFFVYFLYVCPIFMGADQNGWHLFFFRRHEIASQLTLTPKGLRLGFGLGC